MSEISILALSARFRFFVAPRTGKYRSLKFSPWLRLLCTECPLLLNSQKFEK